MIYSRQLGRDGGGLSAAEEEGLAATLDGLDRLGRSTLVLDDNPLWPMDMHSCTHRHALALPGQLCTWDADYFAPRHQAITDDLAHALSDYDAELVSVHSAFCDDSACIRATSSSPLYSDADHLTAEGAALALREAVNSSESLNNQLLHG